MKKKMTLKEVVVLALIAVVMGVVSLGIDFIYTPITTALGPIGGAIIYGLYLVSALLPMYIVRKPFSGIVGSFFTGLVNLLLGSPYGINIIVAALLQGLGVELGVLTGKYEKFDLKRMGLGSVLAMILVTIRDYFVFGFGELGSMMPLIIVIRIFSSIILGASLSIVIGNALTKTGALSGFEISKQQED